MSSSLFAWPSSIKRTRARKILLDLLHEQTEPICAQRLHAKINARGDAIALSTVYRALEAFEASGVVIKSMLPEEGLFVYELCQRAHKHLAVCIHCRKIVPVLNCPCDALEKVIPKHFHATRHHLQIYGYCDHCHGMLVQKIF